MEIKEIEFHDSRCSELVIALDGLLVLRFDELRVEVVREGENEAWHYRAELRIRGSRRVELTKQLPMDGEIISATFDTPHSHESYFRWLLGDGAAISSCTIVFSSGAELTIEAESASVKLMDDGTYVQTYD